MRLLALLLILAGALSSAAQEAVMSGSLDDESETVEVPVPQLYPHQLFGSANIPKVEALDEMYSDDKHEIHGNKAKDKIKARAKAKVCRSDWSQMQAKAEKVSIRPLLPSIVDEVEGNSKKMGFSMSKFKRTLAVYMTNRVRLARQNVIAFIDYDRTSRENRMFIVNLESGKVNSYQTPNGRGSDPKQTGEATVFTNGDKTWTSSLGCFVTGGFYPGDNGKSLRLHGFQQSNYLACRRDIVIHKAKEMVKHGPLWRTQGCPAVLPSKRDEVFEAIGEGALLCSYRDKSFVDEAPVMKSKKKRGKKRYKSRRARRARR